MTIHELRKNGFKVRVTHFRRHLKDPKKFLRRDEIFGHDILTQKGITRVEIKLLDGEEVYALHIHYKNYNKKIGVESCLSQLSHHFESYGV